MFELSPAHSFITTIKYRACNIGIIHAIFAIYSAMGEADIDHIFGVKIREYLKITDNCGSSYNNKADLRKSNIPNF